MIYIILVNWRRYPDTIECLESLTRVSGPAFKIIVVDNESNPSGVDEIKLWADGARCTDATHAVWNLLPAERKRKTSVVTMTPEETFDPTRSLVTVVQFGLNGGFAGANNIGARFALSDPTCEYVWFLNNDTVVAEWALEALLSRTITNSAIGICGSTLLYYDAPRTVQSLGGRFNCLTGRGENLGIGTPLADLPPTDAIEEQLEYVIGASMLVSRRFLEEIGLMEEEYFLYFEELNWSRRARGRYRLAWARESVVYHKEGASIGTDSRNRSSNISLYYYNLSYLKFIRRFHPRLMPIAVANVIAKCVAFLLCADLQACRALWNAVVAYWRRKGRK